MNLGKCFWWKLNLFLFSFFTIKYHRYLKSYLFHKICWRIFWDKLGFSTWVSNWQLKKLLRSPVQTYWERPCKFNSFICENSFSFFFYLFVFFVWNVYVFPWKDFSSYFYIKYKHSTVCIIYVFLNCNFICLVNGN